MGDEEDDAGSVLVSGRAVSATGLCEQPILWEQDGFVLADGYDLDAERYRGLVLPLEDGQQIQIADQTLIVRPDVATSQRAVEGEPNGGRVKRRSPRVPRPERAEPRVMALRPKLTRFFASKVLLSVRYAMDFKNIGDEVIAHLTAAPGTTVKNRRDRGDLARRVRGVRDSGRVRERDDHEIRPERPREGVARLQGATPGWPHSSSRPVWSCLFDSRSRLTLRACSLAAKVTGPDGRDL